MNNGLPERMFFEDDYTYCYLSVQTVYCMLRIVGVNLTWLCMQRVLARAFPVTLACGPDSQRTTRGAPPRAEFGEGKMLCRDVSGHA